MSLTARGLDVLREDYPQGYSSLQDIVRAVNQVASTIGVGAMSTAATPQNTGAIDAVATDGIFDVAISDNNPQRGEYYFLEYDTNSDFSNAITIMLGPCRNWRGMLGSSTYYWRWYKQLLGSNVSGYGNFGGSTPTGVAGGGPISGPPPHNTEGSGTSQQPGKGWGTIGATKPTPVNV